MKITEIMTSSAGTLEIDSDSDGPRTWANGSFRYRDDVVKLNLVPYADVESMVLYSPPDINKFMLTKPA
jgi:hypothetical protein